jgi:oligopeptide/dipeptide ABC transporter ATP-binding protein
MGRGATRARVAELLEAVGLDARLADRLPGTLSGGQLQRAAIARALAPEPDILVCDEPVASMDVSVRAQILNLLLDLRRTRGIGILFVSHDLGVVRRIADRVAVMYLGRIVETGASEPIWRLPRHPYTRALAASIPTGSTSWRAGMGVPRLEGEPPSPVDVPAGCRFHPRCPIAIDRCRVDDPVLRPFPPDTQVACHLAELAAEQAAPVTWRRPSPGGGFVPSAAPWPRIDHGMVSTTGEPSVPMDRPPLTWDSAAGSTSLEDDRPTDRSHDDVRRSY